MFYDFLKKIFFLKFFRFFSFFQIFSNFGGFWKKILGRTAGRRAGRRGGGKVGENFEIRGGKNQLGIMFRPEIFENRSDFHRDCANGERRPGCLRKQGHESFALGPETRFDRL